MNAKLHSRLLQIMMILVIISLLCLILSAYRYGRAIDAYSKSVKQLHQTVTEYHAQSDSIYAKEYPAGLHQRWK